MANDGTQGAGGPSFARTGMGCPLGAFTEPVKTLVDPDTHAAWLRLCNTKDTTSSELLRDVVYLLVHGKTPSEITAEDRRALLRGEGPNSVRVRILGEAA